jgi:hypothetical protein
MALGQGQQRAASGELDVVRVRAEREHRQRTAGWHADGQGDHASTTAAVVARTSADVGAVNCADRSGSHTIHGQLPR